MIPHLISMLGGSGYEYAVMCTSLRESYTGRVKVTLSRSAYRGAPEYGTSFAEFEYHGNHEPL